MDSILLEATGWGGNCTAEPAPSSFANNVGRLFYIVSAEENTFQSVHDVPYYFSEVSQHERNKFDNSENYFEFGIRLDYVGILIR